jgi:sensor c-di-GMP phosphodiesterase-like protein
LRTHRVHERLDIIGEVHQAIPVGRLISIAMAALIHRKYPERRRHRLQQAVEQADDSTHACNSNTAAACESP